MTGKPGITASGGDPEQDRLHTAAAFNNREPILEVLRKTLEPDMAVLEIGSGSGVHVLHFARNMPEIRWRPSDPDPAMRRSVASWCLDLEEPHRVDVPLDLDVLDDAWWERVEGPVDAMLSINMLHVAPPAAMDGLLAGAGALLPRGACLLLYGPFAFNGDFCGPGNERFDRMLRQRNPEWGLRDVNDIAARATGHGLELERMRQLPAANHVLLLKRT